MKKNVDTAAMMTSHQDLVSGRLATLQKELTRVRRNAHRASTGKMVMISALRTSVERTPGAGGVSPLL